MMNYVAIEAIKNVAHATVMLVFMVKIANAAPMELILSEQKAWICAVIKMVRFVEIRAHAVVVCVYAGDNTLESFVNVTKLTAIQEIMAHATSVTMGK